MKLKDLIEMLEKHDDDDEVKFCCNDLKLDFDIEKKEFEYRRNYRFNIGKPFNQTLHYINLIRSD